MTHTLIRGGLIVGFSFATAGMLAAQTPSPASPPTTTAATNERTDDRMVTVTGCLKQEKDVPGRQPNVAERAGVAEDFILTQAKMKDGKKDGDAKSTDTSGQTSASGSTMGAMYKVEGLDDEKLRAHINQQVEVKGRLDRGMGMSSKPTATGKAPDDLAQIEATSIRMVSAACKSGTN